jgi:hypothetical protein
VRLFQVKGEGTAVAAGYAATMHLADVDDERMEFVVMAGEVLGAFGPAFRGESLFGERLNFSIFCVIRDKGVTNGNAAQVFIDDHGRGVEGVEENGVGGFGADTGESEELSTDCGCVMDDRLMQRFDLAGVTCIEKCDEGFECGSLAQHETGRADEVTEFRLGDFSQAFDREDAACFETGDGTLDTFPGRVLGKVGADDDLEGGLRGPPLLWSAERNEATIHGTETTGEISG